MESLESQTSLPTEEEWRFQQREFYRRYHDVYQYSYITSYIDIILL